MPAGNAALLIGYRKSPHDGTLADGKQQHQSVTSYSHEHHSWAVGTLACSSKQRGVNIGNMSKHTHCDTHTF